MLSFCVCSYIYFVSSDAQLLFITVNFDLAGFFFYIEIHTPSAGIRYTIGSWAPLNLFIVKDIFLRK